MTVQQTVYDNQPLGVPGMRMTTGSEGYEEKIYTLVSNAIGNVPNTIGRAYCLTNIEGDTYNYQRAAIGGAGIYVGILVNPNQYSNIGTLDSDLDPSSDVADGTQGSIAISGRYYVLSDVPVNIGDSVYFNRPTGVLTNESDGNIPIPNAQFTIYTSSASELTAVRLGGLYV